MSVLIVTTTLLSGLSVLFLVFFRKHSLKKALYYGLGIWFSALVVILLTWYKFPVLDTKLGQLLVTITLGLLIWYTGESLFSDAKETTTESKKHKKTLRHSITQLKMRKKATGLNRIDMKNNDSIQSRFKEVKQAPAVCVSDAKDEFQLSEKQVEQYDFEWVLADEIQIQTIAEYVRNHSKNPLDKQNVNLAYGVTDKERKIYLTLIYYLSDLIMRTDIFIDDYKFAFIADSEILLASCGIRRGEILDLQVEQHSKYFEIISQAIAFYNDRSTDALKEAFKKNHPNTSLYQYNDILKKGHLSNFREETLSYKGEPDNFLRSTLHEFCGILYQNSILNKYGGKYTVEDFSSKAHYAPLASRLINHERDVWLYLIGSTDSTHAPKDFLESEWLLFYYKGFVIKLDFEEHKTERRFFKLKCITANMHAFDTQSELNNVLTKQGIEPYRYTVLLQEALNTLHPNYYVL